ncbi:polyprenyl synthetase family protein [Glaciihabitans tibetensis]|uniref:polyprenyl synthetase family protein n=1 Tax=Glaciihabitans tibetensis TaxID=1266600 RepID=UPI001FE9FF93|nr:polyprenyl synthetase family protein [Glaciihabitans tibetensis]
MTSIAPELETFLDYSADLVRGGKRFRALFCYWGWQAVGAGRGEFDPLVADDAPVDLPAVVTAAAALELFHAAALVHDDIMDKSDTRRGAPAAHKRFEALHAEGSWLGSAADFGQSAGLLLGDLLLGWSDEMLGEGLARLASRQSAVAARLEFNTMRTQVTVGQYLDILEEKSWRSHPEVEQLPRSHRVIVYKSAKYSVEAPLAIGAHLGGASADQVESLRAFGLPLGIAYQLRDDLLGVFGDPEVTGKPAGDDLREGKRTVLIALARTKLPSNVRNLLDDLLGDSSLDRQQIVLLQDAVRESGAIEHVERIIDHNVALARTALETADITASARAQLFKLTDTVTQRQA